MLCACALQLASARSRQGAAEVEASYLEGSDADSEADSETQLSQDSEADTAGGNDAA